MLKKLLMNIIMLGCIAYGTSADARMIVIPTVKPHPVRRAAQIDHIQQGYKISLLTKLIGEEINGYKIIDCFVDDNRLYFVLFKDGIFYRTNILMEHVFFSVFDEDNNFKLKVGQLFSKKLEQEQFGDGNVSEDIE